MIILSNLRIMKKIFLLLPITTMVMTLLISYCFAQNSVQPAPVDNNKTFKQTIRNISELGKPPSTDISVLIRERINPKAIDDLQIRYRDVNNVEWISNSDGFVSYFTKDGLMNRVYYDKKGRWIFSVLLYNEDRLSKNVRAIVKSRYFDMSITLVEELQFEDHKSFMVYLEDISCIKIVKVNEEGEFEILQDLTK